MKIFYEEFMIKRLKNLRRKQIEENKVKIFAGNTFCKGFMLKKVNTFAEKQISKTIILYV